MKRRNVDLAKLRRPPLKQPRTRVAEGIYGSIFTYVKFLAVWAIVLMADFVVDFRFEYLWPLWLLLRSFYDSYKYQGLAFSMFFFCITITTDIVCYLFVPVQLLFFTASTYVWVQYVVWQTERGFCLPTVLLWLLFLYVEAAVRLRELKNLPYNLDLCRPFAAHCVGYPVITMGFSVRSSISHRFRLRKQKEVQKENQFYMQLLEQALPVPTPSEEEKLKALPSQSQDGVLVNGTLSTSTTQSTTQNNLISSTSNSKGSTILGSKDTSRQRSRDVNGSDERSEEFEFLEQTSSRSLLRNDTSDAEDDFVDGDGADVTCRSNGVIKNAVKVNNQKDALVQTKKTKSTNVLITQCSVNKDSLLSRLELDIKRLKSDLQLSRNTEQELRSQIAVLSASDKMSKSELNQLRQDNENLQSKLHKQVTGRQQDKQNLAIVERRLVEERKQKVTLENQLATEKRRKAEETALAASRAAAATPVLRPECSSDSCKSRRSELENELKQIRREMKLREDRIRLLERETQALQQYRDSQNETEALMSALGAMQEKNNQLEVSLSAETRLKLDLFSALGDAKRQIEIQQSLLIQKEHELADLKSRFADVMSFVPATPTSFAAAGMHSPSSLAHLFSPSYVVGQMGDSSPDSSSKSGVNMVDYNTSMAQ